MPPYRFGLLAAVASVSAALLVSPPRVATPLARSRASVLSSCSAESNLHAGQCGTGTNPEATSEALAAHTASKCEQSFLTMLTKTLVPGGSDDAVLPHSVGVALPETWADSQTWEGSNSIVAFRPSSTRRARSEVSVGGGGAVLMRLCEQPMLVSSGGYLKYSTGVASRPHTRAGLGIGVAGCEAERRRNTARMHRRSRENLAYYLDNEN